jgi:cellulose synthase/poly-beta-1,6-N-acetylglucosamine synthase-like glycosyltransferase
VECLAALFPHRLQQNFGQINRIKLAVLIPAHNEAAEIGITLESLIPQLKQDDRMIVIADNCTDNTALVAQQYGAIVIERNNPDQRGKGYALDYGISFLESDPPDVVIIIDADCSSQPDCLQTLAGISQQTNRPVQAAYLMESPKNPRTKDLISALAFLVKNVVRSTGLMKLGLPSLLNGTGMAFPWEAINRVSLASGNIVEDLQLGIDLTLAGYPPMFCPQIQVTGRLPKEQSVATVQRTRWEHGNLQILLSQVPYLLRSAIQFRRWELLALALELSVPPLSLLVIFWGLGMAGAILLNLLGTGTFAVMLFTIMGAMIFLGIFLAWIKFGRKIISGFALLSVPFYLLWKIPIYLGFLINPEKNWIRTTRDSDSSLNCPDD